MEIVSSNALNSIQPLVELLTIGSAAGTSASFLTNDSPGPGVSATMISPHATQKLILSQGITHTYLIVKARRKKSFTGNASKTLTAKNWNVRYCNRLVRASSFCSNSFLGNRLFANGRRNL